MEYVLKHVYYIELSWKQY